jgi:hypothetical protein
MVTIAESLNPISEIWASLIVAAVWQSTLLALFIALVTSRLKQTSPVVRYWLWQVVTLKLLILPFWTVMIPLPALFARNILERELACDQAAMNLSNCDAGSYARMLVRVASTATFPSPVPATAVDMGIENVSIH